MNSINTTVLAKKKPENTTVWTDFSAGESWDCGNSLMRKIIEERHWGQARGTLPNNVQYELCSVFSGIPKHRKPESQISRRQKNPKIHVYDRIPCRMKLGLESSFMRKVIDERNWSQARGSLFSEIQLENCFVLL